MSLASIGLNDKAIENIDSAYGLLEQAKEDIRIRDLNNNPDAKDIVQSIEKLQGHLNMLKGSIKGVSNEIHQALREKEEKEKLKKESKKKENESNT